MNSNYLKALVAGLTAVALMSMSSCGSESDKRIELSAQQSFVFKNFLKNDEVTVHSQKGAVTLTGTVNAEFHKTLAEMTVSSLDGVNRVDNRLELIGDRPVEKSDDWIGLKVKYSLFYHRFVSGMNTQVLVSDGRVTLRGQAENAAEKDLAEEYARDIEGVKDVKNEMTVADFPRGGSKETLDEKIDDASITAQVKMAFVSHRSTSALHTGVTTSNGVVTLSGNADNGAEKDMATKVAGAVNGVTKVINTMTINTVSAKN